MLSEDLVSLLPLCVANVRGRSRGPSKTQIRAIADRCGLTAPEEDLGKEMLARALMVDAVTGAPSAGEAFVSKFITAARASGVFMPSSDDYLGDDLVCRIKAAFDREGWLLDGDGVLRPKLLDGLAGRELTVALRRYVTRAQRGADDPELVIGTAKCLEEAVARHALEEAAEGYAQDLDFVATLHMAFDRLGLATPKTTDRLHEDPYNELVIAIQLLGRAVNRLRNDRGDGHGRPSPAVASALEARLSASAAALVSDLLLTAVDDRSPT